MESPNGTGKYSDQKCVPSSLSTAVPLCYDVPKPVLSGCDFKYKYIKRSNTNSCETSAHFFESVKKRGVESRRLVAELVCRGAASPGRVADGRPLTGRVRHSWDQP